MRIIAYFLVGGLLGFLIAKLVHWSLTHGTMLEKRRGWLARVMLAGNKATPISFNRFSFEVNPLSHYVVIIAAFSIIWPVIVVLAIIWGILLLRAWIRAMWTQRKRP